MPHTLMTAIITTLVLLLQFSSVNAETLSDREVVNQAKTDCKGQCVITGLKASEEGYKLARSDLTITSIVFNALNDKGEPKIGALNQILVSSDNANDTKKTKAFLKELAAKKGASDFHKRAESLFMPLSIEEFAEQLMNFAASKPCCSECICTASQQSSKATPSGQFTYLKGDYTVRFVITINGDKAKFLVARGECKNEGV